MHILITGASGFVGRAVVAQLQSPQCPPPLAGAALTLLDVNAPAQPPPGCRIVMGSLDDAPVVQAAFAEPPDLILHLASIPGGMAEQQPALGRAVNIDGTLRLLEAAQASGAQTGKPPRFVFASSIAALGGPLDAPVDDATPLRPQMSYGAHKQIGEILVRDFARRGWIEGLSLRLPGIVARPRVNTGQLSAFMSDVMHALAAHEAYTCPVSPQATMWLMSAACVARNLLHAAAAPLVGDDNGLALTLPALHLSMSDLVAATAAEYAADPALVDYAPNAVLEAMFGRYPPLATPAAERLGFAHDGDARMLALQALSP